MFDSVQLSGFGLFCSLTLIHSLYVISVRQTRALPPPSFRFHLTMDTLGFGCILPTVGRIRDFHPLDTCAAERTEKNQVQNKVLHLLLFHFTSGVKVSPCSVNLLLTVITSSASKKMISISAFVYCFITYSPFLYSIVAL